MKHNTDSGNVLFLILIAVVLFAALSYAVTQSSRGGGSVDRETNKLIAQKFINFGNSVRVGVQRMQLIEGIDVQDINFGENATGSNAIFAAEGGGVAWIDPPPEAYDGGGPYVWSFSKPSNNWGAWGVGTDTSGSGAEAFIWIMNLDEDVCKSINELMGHPYEIPVDSNGSGPLSSGYTMSAYEGEWAWCYQEGSQAPEFIFILDDN